MHSDATASPREDVGAIVARRFAELEDEAAAVAGPAPVRRRAEILVESFNMRGPARDFVLVVHLSIDGRWWPAAVNSKPGETLSSESLWCRITEEAFKASRGR